MKVTVLMSDACHPVVPVIEDWAGEMGACGFDVTTLYDKAQLSGGDILFLISFGEILEKRFRDKFGSTMVVHASDLPAGKGWSPHIWQIIEGASNIVVSLIEAEDYVDSGRVVAKTEFDLRGDELIEEINQRLFTAETALMTFALKNYKDLEPVPQPDRPSSSYPRRSPEDSRLDPDKTILEQFNLLRIVDNERYPAFFEVAGCKYRLKIEKVRDG